MFVDGAKLRWHCLRRLGASFSVSETLSTWLGWSLFGWAAFLVSSAVSESFGVVVLVPVQVDTVSNRLSQQLFKNMPKMTASIIAMTKDEIKDTSEMAFSPNL